MYRLWVRCMAEVIGMMIAIFLAQSNVANELLAYTKGHGMGFGWLSFGYGLGFGFAILLVGWISAFFNPALALAAWINSNGITSAGEYFAISGSCMLGGFLGGILVFLQFWPHFQIVPKPPTEIIITCARYVEEQRDSIDGQGHDPMEQPMYNDNTGVSYDNIQELDTDNNEALHCTKWTPPHLRGAQAGNVKVKAIPGSSRPSGDSAREEDKPLDCIQAQQEDAKNKGLHVTKSTELRGARFGGIDTAPDPHLDALHNSLRQFVKPFRRVHRAMEAEMEVAKLRTDLEKTMEGADGCKSPTKKEEAVIMQQMEEGNSEDRAVAAKYVKAIEKDQIAKLLCFCTRPAIYSPAYNWLCEFMSTIVLIVTIFVFQTQLGRVFPGGSPQFNMASAVFVGVLIILLVVGPGGPTGVAMSPARDFGPRLAHWVLPIKGKGSSEFLSYSWIPFTASLCGAVPAAFITRGINQMIESAATYAVL